MRTGPHTAPQDAEFPVNANSLYIKSSFLRLDEVEGAFNCVNSFLTMFRVTFGMGTTLTVCSPYVLVFTAFAS